MVPEPESSPSTADLGSASRRRLWTFMVPLHLGAFAVLYLATLGLVQASFVKAGAEDARTQLEHALAELPFFAPLSGQGKDRRHYFGRFFTAHRAIGLQLFDTDGKPVSAEAGYAEATPPDGPSRRAVLDFISGDASHAVQLERRGQRAYLVGLMRVVADDRCAGCHPPGELRGVASMRVDYTNALDSVHRQLRQNLGLLIVGWAMLLTGSVYVVRRSVQRSAAQLERQLEAVEEGRHSFGESPLQRPLSTGPLDPVSAELHARLAGFLRRQREQQREVASRLAHADQLASLGQLAAGLAHEIKNPLAGIQGAIEVLRDEVPDAGTHRLYGDMLGELARVNDIIHRLLDTGRPSPPRLAATDVSLLVQDVARLMTAGLQRRGIELRLEIAPEVPLADLDAAKIRQVLLNLVQNAADAIGDGGGHIRLTLGTLPDRGKLVLAVQDDGPGIAETDRERVFEPFFTTKFSGTGLGLSVARSLIEQHGGELEVESQEGQGCTFFVMLPARAAAAKNDEQKPELSEKE